MSNSSKARTVLITGCSAGGIGHALAIEFRTKGFRVFATARRLESMQDLSARGIEIYKLDVTDFDAIRKMREEISTKTGGTLDVLVNNAGQAYPVAITDMELNSIREIFEVNLFAPMVLVKEFSNLLIAAGDARIIHIGSISGIMPMPFSAAYNASKAGLHSFCNTARVELAPFNVKVINIVTGAVQSNISRGGNLPDNSLYKPMEDLYQQKRINVSQRSATPTDSYAAIVVAEAMKANPRAWVWAGKSSFLAWFIDTFLPRAAFDWLMNRIFGMDEFSARLGKAKSKID
ncbi:NAD-P-binding protein [Roridomyces roridus]|uniref:NAD-P-binding protein n=1 Tax=Roridomyces roridus TaxID=1738132 RepID=A0AAD7C9P2_9AGAR|nr:NAD-P-binding protein [Roridomyces roridus]